MAPRSVEHAMDLADLNLEYRAQDKDGEILLPVRMRFLKCVHRTHRFIPERSKDSVERPSIISCRVIHFLVGPRSNGNYQQL